MAKKKSSPLEKVAKRFGITVREARDIATAVSTAAMNVKTGASKSFDTKDIQNINQKRFIGLWVIKQRNFLKL